MKNDIAYLKIAEVWAQCSYATKRQVGAVIVKDLQIISDGYNGTPPGFPNVCEDQNGDTYPYVYHAETNALMKLAKSTQSSNGATMYLTIPPCLNCAKIIAQAGIVRLVYANKTNKTEGLNFLADLGIEIKHLPIWEI